jgi:hypothetical protein
METLSPRTLKNIDDFVDSLTAPREPKIIRVSKTFTKLLSLFVLNL